MGRNKVPPLPRTAQRRRQQLDAGKAGQHPGADAEGFQLFHHGRRAGVKAGVAAVDQHGVLCAGSLQQLCHLVGAVGGGAVLGAAGRQNCQQTPCSQDEVGLSQCGQALKGQVLRLAGAHADECHVHLIISLQRFSTSEAVSPCSGGRRMTTSCAPAAEAAAAFSSKPPAAPPSFVTSQRIWNCSIMA